MIRVILFFVAGAALTLLPGDAPAGCKNVIIQKQAVVAYQPVYQAATYQVGAELRTHSSDERIAELVVQKLQAQALRLPAQSGELPAQPETLPITAPESHSIIKDKCIGCHGTNQKAMDALPAEQFLAHLTGGAIEDYQARERMMVRMLDGSMPPKGPLPGDVLGNALGQIVGAETAP